MKTRRLENLFEILSVNFHFPFPIAEAIMDLLGAALLPIGHAMPAEAGETRAGHAGLEQGEAS